MQKQVIHDRPGKVWRGDHRECMSIAIRGGTRVIPDNVVKVMTSTTLSAERALIDSHAPRNVVQMVLDELAELRSTFAAVKEQEDNLLSRADEINHSNAPANTMKQRRDYIKTLNAIMKVVDPALQKKVKQKKDRIAAHGD